MIRKKVSLRLLVSLCCLSLGLLAPSFASGASHKPTPSTSSEKPKKEEPANTTPTEIKPSPASKPVESKSAEVKPSNEAKPTDEAKSNVKSDSPTKKPENSGSEKKNVKTDVKVNGKSESKSDPKAKNSNPNKNESTKGDKGLGEAKKDEKVDSSSIVPSPKSSKSSTPAITSDAPAQLNSAEVLPESFVRIEKSDGNKATLIVSRQKIGSIIKITITSKGPSK